jgi:hypothetical protein
VGRKKVKKTPTADIGSVSFECPLDSGRPDAGG